MSQGEELSSLPICDGAPDIVSSEKEHRSETPERGILVTQNGEKSASENNLPTYSYIFGRDNYSNWRPSSNK